MALIAESARCVCQDLAKQQTLACRRDVGGKDNKAPLPLESIETKVTDLLKQIQKDMFEKAKAERDSHVVCPCA